MSGENTPAVAESTKPAPERHLFLVLLTILLAVEAAVMVGVVVVLLVDLVTQQAAQFTSAIALTILAIIAAIFVTAVAVASARLRVWSRAAALIWQIILIGVGFGMFQGATARFDLALLFILPAVAGILLLFSKPVTRVLRHESPYDTHL